MFFASWHAVSGGEFLKLSVLFSNSAKYQKALAPKFRPIFASLPVPTGNSVLALFTRVYVQLPDYDKLSQMWALSRKQPQEAVILS